MWSYWQVCGPRNITTKYRELISGPSGKSSLIATLLRVLDMDDDTGTIYIDGLNIREISRETIRERIITVPQEPFLFDGSVRRNAALSSTVSDDDIVQVLTRTGLWSILEERGGLNADIRDQPLSQGQRQIFCLARAMLQKEKKILILDEATSNLDHETDQLMQTIVKENFASHTVITVAHKLDTIGDSDKIAVLDSGSLVEFDSPSILLQRDSAFKRLGGVLKSK